MSESFFDFIDRKKEEHERAEKKWTRKNNALFMREYSRRLYFESRLEGIKHYKCAHCGNDDPSIKYGVFDRNRKAVGKWMDWPALKRRGWPEEYHILCGECRGIYRPSQMCVGGQYLLWGARKATDVQRYLRDVQEMVAVLQSKGENVRCSLESVMKYAATQVEVRERLRWQGRDPWVDPELMGSDPWNWVVTYRQNCDLRPARM